jgi:hypothetical protein
MKEKRTPRYYIGIITDALCRGETAEESAGEKDFERSPTA